ncbi:MAG: glucokinase [Deltaproteobacteria bacterium]|nr:glucokinase [Deltaproteobacteria bacterium]
MLLAGDIGGTKSRLAIFAGDADPRRPLVEEVLPSSRYTGLESLIRAFLKRTNRTADRACFAIAGPVIDGRAAVTNLPWIAEAGAIRRQFGFRSVRFLNDVAATARAIPLLEPRELHTLCPGEPAAQGAIALIAPGTGLGEAFLTWEGTRQREHPSEGGHADFAPGNLLEADLLRELRKESDHVSYEKVCSGPGLWKIYCFLRERGTEEEPSWLARKLAGADDPVPVLVDAALTEKTGIRVQTVSLFCSILGAEAGNLALKTLATGGVYIGGGIAPRILPFLEDGTFLAAFRRKGRMADLLFRMPVHVILETRAALIGAVDCIANG